MITSLAIYDHITSTLLHQNFPISEPLVKLKRKTSSNSQGKDEEGSRLEQNLPEECEYVLDSTPPPLTLGILNTKDMMCVSKKCSSYVFFLMQLKNWDWWPPLHQD